jgi:soluble lytic murein transglycosylase-like protein
MSGAYSGYILNAAQQYNVDPGVLNQLAISESGGNPNQITAESNGTTSYGLLQLNSKTIANPGYGIAPISTQQALDGQTNANFAAQYLSKLLSKFGGDYSQAVAAYNGASSLATSGYAQGSNYPNLVAAIQSAQYGSTQSPGLSFSPSAATGTSGNGTQAACPLGTVFGVSLCVVMLVLLGIGLTIAGVFMLGKGTI